MLKREGLKSSMTSFLLLFENGSLNLLKLFNSIDSIRIESIELNSIELNRF